MQPKKKKEQIGITALYCRLSRDDGTEGDSARAAQHLASLLGAACGLPVVMRDERGTTVTAHQYLNQTDTRGKKRKAVVDAVAATIILQNYLDYRKNNLKK